MASITLHKDPKTHVITLLRAGYGEDITLELDSSGNAELTDEIFKAKSMSAIDIFERENEEILTFEEQAILYSRWGTGLSIMIGTTASLIGISKSLAKDIIIRGDRHGILYQANNYVWKIKDPSIIKSRWIDKAKDIIMSDKPEKVPETTQSRLDKYAEKAKELGIKDWKGEEGMIANKIPSKRIARHESSIMKSPVEIVPEVPSIPRKKLIIDIQVMKQDLKDLEELKEQMRSGIVAETVECNEHILIDKMKVLKAAITNLEIQESNQQFDRSQGVKMNESGSAINVTMIKKSKQEASSQTLVLSKKVLTKGTPLSRTPHGKAHKSTRR